MFKNRFVFLCCISIFFVGCTGGIITSSALIPMNLNSKIAVITFSNYTETPLAGERAMSITAASLEARGFHNLVIYQSNDKNNVLLPGMNTTKSRKDLLLWASKIGAHYVMTGSVNEWTYKVGLDGEPVVGLSLQLIELPSKRIIWTAVGSQSGGSREALSTVSQKLIVSLLNRLFQLNHNRSRSYG